jgi:hypothetical protein
MKEVVSLLGAGHMDTAKVANLYSLKLEGSAYYHTFRT